MSNEREHHHKKNLNPTNSKKDRPRKKSTLGLDDIIFKNTQQNEFDIDNAAKKIAKTMRIKQHVDKASKKGARSTSIPFKKRAKMYAPGLKFKRSLTYYDVFLRLKHILSEDKIDVEYTVGDYGGCCQKPTIGEGWTTCLICDQRMSFSEKHQHSRLHKFYNCNICSLRDQMKTIRDAERHIRKYHTFMCPYCEEIFDDKSIIEHMEIHSEGTGISNRIFRWRFRRKLIRVEPDTHVSPRIKCIELDTMSMSNFKDGKIMCLNCKELFLPIQGEGVYLSMKLSW